MTPALLGAGAAALLGFGLLVAWLLRAIGREQRVGERLLAVQRSAGIDQVALPWSPQRVALRGLAGIGRLLTGGGILSGRTVEELEQTLMAAGFRGDRALAIFVGAKVLLFLGLPLAAAAALQFLGAGQKAWAIGMLASAIGGLLAPDLVARRLRKRYLRELERGLPDALDLMVICSEAGLALEGAVERVAAEIGPANRAVAAEFAVCSSELRILSDRRAALMNMAERTRLELAAAARHDPRANPAIRHAADPGAAHPLGRDAAGPAGAVRGEGGEAAGAADRADDPLHPADPVPGGRRAGHAAGVAAMVRRLLHDARGATAVEFAARRLGLLHRAAAADGGLLAGGDRRRAGCRGPGGSALGRHRPGAAGRLHRDRPCRRHHPEDLRPAAQLGRAQRHRGKLPGLRQPRHARPPPSPASAGRATWCATPWSIAAAA